MEISPLQLLRLLIFSFLFGLTVGLLYDLNRFLQLLLGCRTVSEPIGRLFEGPLPISGKRVSIGVCGKGRRSAMLFLQDLLLFLYAAVAVVLLAYRFNDGRVRFFSLLALLLGALLYYWTVARMTRFPLELLALFVQSVFITLLWVFLRMIAFFASFLRKIISSLRNKFIKSLEKRQKKVYNKLKKEKLLADAENGFLHSAFSNHGRTKGDRI